MQTSDFHNEPLPKHCVAVLEAYIVRDAACKAANVDYAGWQDRMTTLAELTAGELTAAHGFLIAQGLLKFEITGRSVGLQYQVSQQGRESLRRMHDVSETEDDDGRCESGHEPEEESADRSIAA